MEEGTGVSPQRYLADASAAAASVSDFSGALARVGGTARPAVLRQVAPQLRDAFERTRSYAGRLGAQRLEDRRLEDQRAAAVAALDRVVDAQEGLVAAAEDGDGEAAARAAAAFAAAVGSLRSLSTDS